MSGVEVVQELEPQGIAAAAAQGETAIGTDAVARGVLLGGLPFLILPDFDAALASADHHSRSFVRAAQGSGTILVTARSREAF